MNLRRLNLEISLYILALALALGVRLYHLGSAPLSDYEASWAMQALQIVHPEINDATSAIGPQPAYVFLTAILFTLSGASDFAARLWPALAGSLLVLAPFCFKRDLGRVPALILAFGLALDPGLTAVSRQAGGPMLALAFGLLALGLWRARQPVMAGISAGLALLSGPALLQGLLAVALSWALLRLGKRRSPTKEAEETPSESPTQETQAVPFLDTDLRQAIAATGVVVLVLGSFFFLHPQGLAAWFGALPTYLEGWAIPSGLPALRVFAALVFYQPFALIFALLAVLRWLYQLSQADESRPFPTAFLFMWAIFSLLLTLLYPARQVSDLVWVLVPLWALAAYELGHYLPQARLNPISMLQAALILILAALFWNSLITTNQIVPMEGIPWIAVRAAVLLGILALGGLTTALVALGWTWEVSRNGLVWGATAAFAIYSLAALWGAAILRPNQPSELWGLPPGSGQTRLFSATLKDLSDWTTGLPVHIDVVSALDAPSLRWALRDYPDAHFSSEIPLVDPSVGDSPSIIITNQQDQPPALTDAYRGQDFVWRQYPGWQGALPEDLISWLAFRQAPQVNEKIILWARSDLFPGGVLDTSLNPDQTE